MKIMILISGMLFLLSATGVAQNTASTETEKIKNGEAIYFIFDNNRLEYFTSEKPADSRKEVKETTCFLLKDHNSCNIYMKWINPLKYRITWNDSEFVDERDQAINDFIGMLIAQFGMPASSLNEEKRDALSKEREDMKRAMVKLEVPEKGFNNADLNLLYLELGHCEDLLQPCISQINDMTKLITQLDALNSMDISKEVDNIFTDLINLSDPEMAAEAIPAKEELITGLNIDYSKAELLQNNISKALSNIRISYKILSRYMETVISRFVAQTAQTLIKNRNLTSKLIPVIDIVKNSLADESLERKGFFRIRNAGFDDGKKLQCALSISEYEYLENEKRIAKKADVIHRTLVFQKYDIIHVSVSTGIFYSSATLKGFGISNSSGGELAVTEDNITKNSPATAVFLNLTLDIGSRYWMPLTQLGIDPTKKRPFLLMGIGFLLPTAKIAFSGGPIWTWDQSLNKLSVGQTITSTTELEKDIQYKFDGKPKGWYFGIEYNF